MREDAKSLQARFGDTWNVGDRRARWQFDFGFVGCSQTPAKVEAEELHRCEQGCIDLAICVTATHSELTVVNDDDAEEDLGTTEDARWDRRRQHDRGTTPKIMLVSNTAHEFPDARTVSGGISWPRRHTVLTVMRRDSCLTARQGQQHEGVVWQWHERRSESSNAVRGNTSANHQA